MTGQPELSKAGAERLDGPRLRDALVGAAAIFDRHIAEINALNVFPVPDGDTGTNMGLTLKSAVREALSSSDASLPAVSSAAAKGALLGARGNSGVILSQFLRGVARALEHVSDAGPAEVAQALTAGSVTAYKAVIRPVEGTMLTVSKDMAAAAVQAAESGADLAGVAAAAVAAARDSVAHTPDLLPVLREANVVDAGGQGLLVILDGVRGVIAGDQTFVDTPVTAPSSDHKVPLSPSEPRGFGYCVEFIIRGTGIDTTRVRQAVEELGSSALAVGDEQIVKVHVHTRRPGRVLEYGVSLGTLHDIKIDNMDEQHRETLISGAEASAAKAPDVQVVASPAARTSLVAVATGKGFSELMRGLGVATVVPGGQTMNPSTEDLLKAVQESATEEVVVLPNNGNILLAAQQARQLTNKRVAVIPTHDMAQGVAVCLAYRPDRDLASNARAMELALRGVHTAEVTTAVRAARLNGFNIKPGEALGLTDGRLVAVRPSVGDVLVDLLQHMDAGQAEVLTVYYGADVDSTTAQQLAASATAAFPGLASEVVEGGQPLYQFLIALE